MTRWLVFVFTYVTRTCRSHASLQLEVAALRYQLAIYKEDGRRPRIQPADRLLWSVISRCWSHWRRALYLVQPRTVLEWQKKRFRDHRRELSRASEPGRPRMPPELRALIRRMWVGNPIWGLPRIVLELKKLGIDVAKSIVEKYKPKRIRPNSPGWRTFLRLHAKDLAAIDFFVVPTAELKVLFVLVVLGHDRRRALHFNVTEHPTAEWTTRQLVEAFPFESAPRYLLRDGDAPDTRPIHPAAPARTAEVPAVQGLRHYYLHEAAGVFGTHNCEIEPMGVYAMYAHRQYLSGKVRTFVEFLAGYFGSPPYWECG